MDAKHNELIEEYKKKYSTVINNPKEFIEKLKKELIEEEIDKKKLVEIHQQLYLYYYEIIKDKYANLVEFFKHPDNEDFRDTLYKISNNDNFKKDISSLLNIPLNRLYLEGNTLKDAITIFLNDVNDSYFYIKNIINIFKLYKNQRIDIKFIKAKINTEINAEINADKKQLKTSFLDSRNTTKESFLETISRIEGDISSGSKFNVTKLISKKGINNQKKQLLYFCQLFSELESNDYKDKHKSLNQNYNNLITTLKDHISKFLKNIENSTYAIMPTTKESKFIIEGSTSIEKINHIETLNKLKKYILNESLINELIKEYKTYFNSKDKDSNELTKQKESKEFKEVIKSEIKANKKEFTDLIPLTPTEKIGQFVTSTLSKSIENIQSKLPAYLNNIIIIIIFLIFLNLFITTYFYFTTSIQATANRSNCGGASLCEAETHRHLFLEDNGNDKARDIYIIIVVIFSIYLLSEIFKSYKDGIKFEDDNNISVPIFVLFLYFAFIFGTISGIIYNTTPKPSEINLASSIAFIFYLLIIGIIFLYHYIVKKDDALDNIITKGLTVVIALTIIGFEIGILAEGSKYDLFQGFSDDGGSGLLNPNFNANTALHLIFLVFYLTFFAVVFKFNKDIKSLHIWGLVFLGFILFTLFIFILLSSLDFKNTEYTYHLQNIKHSTSSMQYFVLILPLVCLWCFRSELKNAIKLIVLYYAILFIIYLFYVYFVNHSNETGILSLESFQLYNWESEDKNEKIKGSKEELNYKKELNKANTGFVFILLIILIGIGGLNKDPNLDNIIYGIIVFILASYITGIVYLLYNTIFPIQQASFNYKKNLVDINNEISQHIKVELEEHTIDKNKIRVFKIANENKDIEAIYNKIDSQRNDGTKDKEKHMKNIRDIFSEISPKGSIYEDYRSQSIHQMQYEEYIYLLFNNKTNSNIINNYDYNYYSNLLFAKNIDESNFSYEVPSSIAQSQKDLYNQIILNVPNTLRDISYDIDIKSNNNLYLSNLQLNIPKTNNIEYVIKKNYKYVTGEEGVIQKYNVLSNTELDCLYYKEITENPDSSNQNESGNKLTESIKAIKNIKTMNDVIITNIATVTTYQEIYKLNQDIFDHYKTNHTIGDNIIIKLGTKKYENITHSSITSTESTESTEYDKLNPAFYTIGYDYENYTYDDKDHQQMNKDTAYSIPARYYACSYLNYFPNEDGSMSKVKFAKNIKEDNYNPLNAKNTIIDRIAKRYNDNAKETKIQLAPEKFQFLLVFLVILAIILLMFLFNIIKKYFTGDVYTPQMYVLGILGVFLTIFIFGEVIFARIK